MGRLVKMDDADMVATAVEDIKKGEESSIFSPDNVVLEKINALENIPFGNKIALMDIPKGKKVLKYGAEIGETTSNIEKGSLVHVHNLKSLLVDIPASIKEEIMSQMNIKGEGE